ESEERRVEDDDPARERRPARRVPLEAHLLAGREDLLERAHLGAPCGQRAPSPATSSSALSASRKNALSGPGCGSESSSCGAPCGYGEKPRSSLSATLTEGRFVPTASIDERSARSESVPVKMPWSATRSHARATPSPWFASLRRAAWSAPWKAFSTTF